MQYDPRDEIRLEEIERIQNDNKQNDALNFVTKFDLGVMGNFNKEWMIKSRKKTLKQVLPNYTKNDHMRFKRQIEKSFTRKDGT